MPLTPQVAIARADIVARAVFVPNAVPDPLRIYAELRPLCADAGETEQVWQLVSIRLAELQSAAEGCPVISINERAAA